MTTPPYRGAHITREVKAIIEAMVKNSLDIAEMNLLIKTQLPLMVNQNMLDKISEVNDLLFFNQFQMVTKEEQ